MKKSIFLSSLIILVSILSVTVSSAAASSFLAEISVETESAQSLDDYKNIGAKFDDHATFLSLFLRDSALSEIDYTIKELIAFAEFGSDEAEVVKNRLCCLIEQQRRLSGLNITSIF